MVLLRRLHINNSLKASSLRSDERPDLGSSLNDVLPNETFKTSFRLGGR